MSLPSTTPKSAPLGQQIGIAALVVLAVLIGGYIRLRPVMAAGFPLNDGGLFYVMAQDIVHSNFALPAVSSYNAIQMPFAYPPLAFYIAAFLNTALHWNLLEIVQYFPAIMNTLTIAAFYPLARTILRSRLQAIFATFAFALLPRAFKWLIMGGGLTRSLGFFFAVIALQQAYLLYTTHQRRYLLPTIILASLTALSHPEIALYTACSIGVFFLFYWRTREGLINSMIAGAGVIILTAPWWLSVVSAHGLSPLLSAFQTGEYATYPNVFILLFTGLGFSEDVFLGFVGLLGIVKVIADGRWFLPAWLVALFVIDPRGAPTYATIPLALLIAIFIDEVMLAAIFKSGAASNRTSQLGKRIAFALLVSFLVSYGYVFASSVPSDVLAMDERAAMQWAAANTPDQSSFAVVTGSSAWASDLVAEWFPVLSHRQSLATVQGFEWFPNRQFFERRTRHEMLQACANQDVKCLITWAQQNGIALSYVYLSDLYAKESALQQSLASSPAYDLVYAGPGPKIYKKRADLATF